MLKVEILTPPDATLLSSMLYEGFLKMVSECSNEAEEECVRKVLRELKEKEIDFRFTGNDIKYTLGKISKEFKVNLRTFQDLMDFLQSMRFQNLRIAMRVLRTEKGVALNVGTPDFIKSGKEGYSFQIMKTDRYMGLSSSDYGMFKEKITTYTDLSGLLIFFTGLASSYVTSSRFKKETNYYFLFFDTETLLSYVLEGDIGKWMDIKKDVSENIRQIIEEYGDINDEAITLSVLYNIQVLEELRGGATSYVGFRLVKVSMEGYTYKIYVDLPLRIYARRRIYEDIKGEKELAEEISRVIEVLIPSASRFVRGADRFGDGYHAFKALRYLYLYVTTEDPSYLAMMYRELHEAYQISSRNGDRGAGRYLRCFLRHTMRF
ncbi:MAG: hypothetical protein QXL22_06205 [Candidatus Nezhaarchaeales archaeon]